MKYQNTLALIVLRALILLILFCLPILINAQQMMRINLYAVSPNGDVTLMDGNMTNYDPTYSNNLDMLDALKLNNFGENLGIQRHGQTLVVERRQTITEKDTSFLRMWNMQAKEYQLQIITKQFNQPWLNAYLKDNYLNHLTKIYLNDTTDISFYITADTGSSNSMRFEIVFSLDNGSSVPVTFMDFKSYRKGQGVEIEWNILNEVSVDKYVIEHSSDGRIFNTIQMHTASNNGYKSYHTTHPDALSGDNFYRIKAYRLTGSVEYSPISKVSALITPLGVYPNPVVNRKFNLKIDGKEAGVYSLTLVSSNGVAYPLKPVKVVNGQSEPIDLPAHIVPGIYRLKINVPGNPEQIITVYLL